MMNFFNCRLCSESPFGYLFDGDQQAAPTNKDGKPVASKSTKKSDGSKPTRKRPKTFEIREPSELASIVKQWEQYVHPRAREFFPTPEMLEGVLMQIAKGIHRDDDPVLGDDTKCVPWYGDVTKDDQQAAIRMIKPGETQESITYVNRVLAFIFATDESFEQLMRLPKEPFKMSCSDQLCVNLAHISLQVFN